MPRPAPDPDRPHRAWQRTPPSREGFLLEYVDTHCHLDHHDTVPVADQVEHARAAGVRTLITVGTDMASSTQAVRTAARYDNVWAVVGVHPNDAMEASPRVLEVIEDLAGGDMTVGVGETGLDYYRDHTTPEEQAAAFRAHIGMAKRTRRTLVIHCRDAWGDCLSILEDEGAPERVVMHCFSGDASVVARCAGHGWFISFAGNVTFHNAMPLREAAAAVPPELLLTETDSPYLTPHPHRGRPNEPAHIPLVVETLAAVQQMPVSDLASQVLNNARRAFALPAAEPDAVAV